MAGIREVKMKFVLGVVFLGTPAIYLGDTGEKGVKLQEKQ